MAETTPRKPSSKTDKRKNWYALSSLGALSRELEKLDKGDLEMVLPLILKSGIVRVSGYISKHGKRGMIALQNAARWIDDPNASFVRIKSFKSQEDLMKNFRFNQESLGEVWHKKWQKLRDEYEYLGILRQIIASPFSNRIIWNAPSISRINPYLGYVYKEGKQKPILVVINQNGFIERGEVLESAWNDILAEMDDFYKIDNFPDTVLEPAR